MRCLDEYWENCVVNEAITVNQFESNVIFGYVNQFTQNLADNWREMGGKLVGNGGKLVGNWCEKYILPKLLF